MTSLGAEVTAVQRPLVRYATEVGWDYLSQADALSLRRGATGTLLYSVLRERLIELNRGLVTPENVDEIIEKIDGVRPSIEGNEDVLQWIRGQRGIYFESKQAHLHVCVVDFEQASNNRFQVTDEWELTSGTNVTNRADVMFLINGIPVALVETKGVRKKDGIDWALTQVRRYHRETPELLAHSQVFDVTHLVDWWYGVTWSLDRKSLFNWKEEEPGNFERKVKVFFARERFLRLLQDWIRFYRKDDELRKICLRQHQVRAVEKVLERALDPEKTRGLIWHTQGSGKTFTMMTAAELILRDDAFAKPTVILLIDREELQGQLVGKLTESGITARVAESKADLREVLGSGYRGLVVSMVHKFDGADADLCTRENVFVLVDEAHRTTGGDLGNYLVAALPKATFVGFTGTPIDKAAHGKGTFKIFGSQDGQGYLDKYSIRESIVDGTTLPLHYTLAPSQLHVPKEELENEFLALAEAEGISDIADLNRILDRALNLKTFMKATDRVKKVAEFVAQDFKMKVDPLGFKAFLVTVDREACALYKKALDQHLPTEWSQVVYSSAHNDEAPLTDYKLSSEDETKVRKAFSKPGSDPRILIVTEKLLTGFDAPILYCMYLDKPMRDHTLLQAIARVNRPYETEGEQKKRTGLVVDFVGIFDKLERALAFDSDVVNGVIEDLDLLRQRFGQLINERAPQYLELVKPPVDDKTVERVIEEFSDKTKRESFFDFIDEIVGLYEILSPDAFLHPFLDRYRRLIEIYDTVLNARPHAPYRDVARKTEMLVRESVTAYGLLSKLNIVPLDAETLAALKNDDPSTTKLLNLGKSIVVTCFKEGPTKPYLIPLAERAQAVLEAFDDRQTGTREALGEMEKVLEQYLAAEEERKKLGLDARAYALYATLTQAEVVDALTLVGPLDTEFRKHPSFLDDPEQLRLLKAGVYKILLPTVPKDRMKEIAERLLRVRR